MLTNRSQYSSRLRGSARVGPMQMYTVKHLNEHGNPNREVRTRAVGRNRACPRRCVASAVCTLTCADWSLRDWGQKMAPSPAQAESSQ